MAMRKAKQPVLTRIVNESLETWHGYDSVNRFYTGHGFVLKAAYGAYSDNSGHFLAGYELSRYGVQITTYPVTEEFRYDGNAGIDQLAARLNRMLPDMP
jgi:hypothetical protein